MSKDLNQCNFIGRIGQDLDLKHLPNGDAVLNFSIACNDDYKDKNTGQKVEKTNWVNIVSFRRQAEVIAEYCKKGSRVFISGKQTTRKWQGEDGADRYTTEIVANQMQMLDSRSSAEQDGAHAQPQSAPQQPAPSFDDFDDDIPF